ncbi:MULTISPECIES: hypothetical protein [Bacillales]|jgi:hypothetical protein|uniref:hypothetical protein n=1 Tax=Brevibacillus TaxID=55080 RepID=UPI001490C0A1|nr:MULTISPECIES: hypothetical protein [Bacillales]MBR8660960.1 hypothetical protein [Brevibacillus sp. NL20B1]MDT3416239.1 hypothetical protein [Brevibacillus aydinogluensis]NNV01142.1 hypothetical protein [Brevibacillus sp. MCWH]UFJ63179.1 hypothetical protein IRT44_04865 [Anoxybacillus sediminis]
MLLTFVKPTSIHSVIMIVAATFRQVNDNGFHLHLSIIKPLLASTFLSEKNTARPLEDLARVKPYGLLNWSHAE